MAKSESTRINFSVARQSNRERRAVIVAPNEYMAALDQGQRLAKSGIDQMIFLHGQEELAQRWLDHPAEVGLMVILDPSFRIESAPMAA